MIDGQKIIVSLDGISIEKATRIAEMLAGRVWGFKLNDLLYEDADVIRIISSYGKIFADVKLFDIPNTVANSVRRLVGHGADIITVHIQGGEEMMKAAKNAAPATTILGVTVLTSVEGDVTEDVLILAKDAKRCGLDGIVCSGRELPQVRLLDQDSILVVPGIRPLGYASSDDQARTVTPREAIDAGATYLVIGRPIVEAGDPLVTLDTICRE